MSFGPPPPPSAWTHSAMTQISRRKRKRSRVVGIIVALTVIVTASVAGVWFTMSQTDDPPSASKGTDPVRQLHGDVRESIEKPAKKLAGTELFAYASSEDVKGDGTNANPGTWLTEKHLVSGQSDGKKSSLEATELTKESENAWSLPLPGLICATTDHVTVDGRTAVLLDPLSAKFGQTCKRIAVVDLNKGKLLWTQDFPNSKAEPGNLSSVAISQNTAVAAWGYGSAAYDLTKGKLRWAHTQASRCENSAYLGGRQLLALVRCTASGQDAKNLKVAKIHPATGKREWIYTPGDYGHDDLEIISTSPVVIGIYTKADSSPSHIIALTHDGKMRSTIPVSSDLVAVHCGSMFLTTGTLGKCEGITVSNKYVFIESVDGKELDAPGNNVAAYDLATGKGVARFDSTPILNMKLFQANGDNALAYQVGGAASPGTVYELDASRRTMTPFLFFNTEEGFNPRDQEIRYRDGYFAVTEPSPMKGDVSHFVMCSQSLLTRPGSRD